MSEPSDHDRIVIIETTMKKDADALILSRGWIEKETHAARAVFDTKLEHLNGYQRKMDNLIVVLESRFATRESVEWLKKTIWIGMAIMIVLQILIPVLIHVYTLKLSG